VYVTGVGEGSRNVLGSREHQTLGGFLGFREVMDRMDANPQGESAQNEHEAERCRSSPAPQALSHGKGHQHEEHEGQRRPRHRRCCGLSYREPLMRRLTGVVQRLVEREA